MGFGLIGKTPGTRLVSGSRYYGERTREALNRKHRLFPNKVHGRTIMMVGKKAVIVVGPKKKTRKPTSKRVAAQQ